MGARSDVAGFAIVAPTPKIEKPETRMSSSLKPRPPPKLKRAAPADRERLGGRAVERNRDADRRALDVDVDAARGRDGEVDRAGDLDDAAEVDGGRSSGRPARPDAELLDVRRRRERDGDVRVRRDRDRGVDDAPGLVDAHDDRRAQMDEAAETDERRRAFPVDRELSAAEVDDADLAAGDEDADRVGIDVAVREPVRAVAEEELDVLCAVEGGTRKGTGAGLDGEVAGEREDVAEVDRDVREIQAEGVRRNVDADRGAVDGDRLIHVERGVAGRRRRAARVHHQHDLDWRRPRPGADVEGAAARLLRHHR